MSLSKMEKAIKRALFDHRPFGGNGNGWLVIQDFRRLVEGRTYLQRGWLIAVCPNCGRSIDPEALAIWGLCDDCENSLLAVQG